jgi:predicted RNase H-like HicB family nuclease
MKRPPNAEILMPLTLKSMSEVSQKLHAEIDMKYAVVIEESDEGFAVSVPGLPGCHSQGTTEAEALENIADAIREYRNVAQELARSKGAKQAMVEV